MYLRITFLGHDDRDHGLRLLTGIPSLGYFVHSHFSCVFEAHLSGRDDGDHGLRFQES
jgi:hypothetical protein